MYNDYNHKEVARASRIGLRLSDLRFNAKSKICEVFAFPTGEK